jgi:hypothetical protein
VRFRPFASATSWTALLSVRFTAPARDATEAAFSARIGAKGLRHVQLGRRDTVLVFDPASVLPFGPRW